MFDANTTLNQLAQVESGGMGRLIAMLGAKNFVQSEEESFVSFKWSMKAKNKSNYIKITLNASDYYDVEFGYIRAGKYTVRSVTKDLDFMQLLPHYEEETANYLSI